VLKGMRQYVRRFGDNVDGVGIDTWGLDFGLIDEDGRLLENPIHYRDKRTEGMGEKVYGKMPAADIFQRTGVAFQPIYTLGQLLSLRLNRSSFLAQAGALLMMPDLLAYFLTGTRHCERSNATTTQLYDPHKGSWSEKIFDTFDLPTSIMPEIIDPGTVLGEMDELVKRSVGLKSAVVIAPCTHDTPSAVAGVPGVGDSWAFVSSGTWSVLGSLSGRVVTSPEAYETVVCNELTVDGFFVCRNIIGLWLLQQVRAVWQRGGESHSYEQLVQIAEHAAEGGPLIRPDDARFLNPDNMCQAIDDYCRATGQRPPAGPAETTRCILESLALSYRHGLEQFSRILERSFDRLNIVGGGSLNTLLCQFAADASGLGVVAGPAEATVAGNVLVQALALGHLHSPAEIREVIRQSTPLTEYLPKDSALWKDRYAKYLDISEQTRG